MENENMNKIELNREQLEIANSLIFDKWFEEELLPKMVKPASNTDVLKSIFLEAQRSNSEVPILTVGCQPMDDVATSKGQTMSVVSVLSQRSNSRPFRWAQGFAGLQTALQSFGIKSKLFLSLSDMELLAQRIDNPEDADLVDTDKMKRNVSTLVDLINSDGGNVVPFSHSEALMRGCSVTDIRSLISALLPQWNGERLTHTTSEDTTEPLPTALYDADPSILPHQLFGSTPSNLIWLDMMSDLATQDHLQLKDSISRNLPNSPLIAPVTNGGNWSAAGEPVTIFRNKAELICLLLGVETEGVQKREELLERIQNTLPDVTLLGFLSSLGINNLLISDLKTREFAIRSLETIIFGDTTFTISKMEEVEFTESRLKSLISQVGGVNSNQAFIQINQGNVKVNGVEVRDLNFIPQRGDTITVGRKLKFKIK
jgi:hypothetical protein